MKMNNWSRYIGWLLGSMMVLLIQACQNNDQELQKEAPTLQIHVFTPEHPIVTRNDNGPVAADNQEKKLTDLRIWVFEHGNGALVGYLHPDVAVNSGNGGTFLMAVSDDFAARRPNVDVYVMANVMADNSNITSVPDGSATREQLDAIMIGHIDGKDPFGLTAPKTSLGDGDYLPMSGVLKNQPVTYNAPVLSINNVQVVRAVSKVRFVFSRSASVNQEVRIKKITFNGGVIPKAEYLFLNEAYTPRSYHIDTSQGYEGTTSEENVLLDKTGTTDIPITAPSSLDPAKFAWNGASSGQEYEKLINEELEKTETEDVKREIVEGCRAYLRESDKVITGKIYYTLGESDEVRNEAFSLWEAGDFSRNHTWVVYGYFAGGNHLRIFTVSFTEWDTLPISNHEVYNW